MHTQPIGPFFNEGAEFGGFFGHGSDAVGFFDAPTADVAQSGGRVGVQRHHRQRHGSVGDVVAIEFNAFERPASTLDVQRIGTALHQRAHLRGGFNKANIALNRICAHAFDRDACAIAQGAQRNEITGR